jgi:hypothetical protein
VRKIEVDIEDLIDVFIAGLAGDWQDYLFVFLRDNCHITSDEVKEYAKKLGQQKGYSKEDEIGALRDASYYWTDILVEDE